jgi:AcrR family transcriptional regulator
MSVMKPRPAGSATRQALLDAASAVVCAGGRGGWARARMADVAAGAGVSRQTLYNEFGSKEALGQALALREAERFIAATEASLAERRPGGPAAAVAAAVEGTLLRAADNPLLKAVLTDDVGGLLPYLTTRAEPILTAARHSIGSYLATGWPDLPGDDVALAAETVVRLTVSYLVLPSDAADASAGAVAARVARLVDRLLANGRQR